MFYERSDTYAKARVYTAQPDRYFEVVGESSVLFNDEDHVHHLTYSGEGWVCDCHEFERWQQRNLTGYTHFCAHVVALEKLLAQGWSPFFPAPHKTAAEALYR